MYSTRVNYYDCGLLGHTMSKRNIGKNVLFAIIAVTFSCLISLGILEVILRIFQEPGATPGYTMTHETRRYQLKPNFSGKTHSAEFKINSYGLRDYERTISTGDETYRIAVFGDSVTFGIGIKLEETFSKILEKKLNLYHYPLPIQLFNMGIGSYNTVQEYYYLKESHDRFIPHMVIFEYTAGNDSCLTNPGHTSDINKIAAIRWGKDILRNLHSYNFLAAEYYALLYKAKQERKYENEYIARLKNDELLFAENFKGWIENKKAFRDIATFCKNKNITLIFAVYANNFMLSPSLDKDPYYLIINKIINALKQAGVQHIILLDDSFREYAGNEKKLWVTPTNHHFSLLANKLAADTIFQYICENKLIENHSVSQD